MNQAALNQCAPNAYAQLNQMSATRLTQVHLIIPDNHTEGLAEPLAAFHTKARADLAMELLADTGRTYRLATVKLHD